MRNTLLLCLATAATAADQPTWSLTAGAALVRPEGALRDYGNTAANAGVQRGGGAVEADPGWTVAPELVLAWRRPELTWRLRAWWLDAEDDEGFGDAGTDAYPIAFLPMSEATRVEANSELTATTVDITGGSSLRMTAGPSFAPEAGLRVLVFRSEQHLDVDDTTDVTADERVRSLGIGPVLAMTGRWGFGAEGRFGLQCRLVASLLRTAVDIERDVASATQSFHRDDDDTRLASTLAFRLAADARLGRGFTAQLGWQFARWSDVGDRATHFNEIGTIEGAPDPSWESFDLLVGYAF